MRKVVFTEKAKNDFQYFEKFDSKNLKKILNLIDFILIENPFLPNQKNHHETICNLIFLCTYKLWY